MVKSLIGWASWESNFLFPKLFACHVWSAALGHHCCPSLPLMRADELVLRDTIWTGLPLPPLPPSFSQTSDSCVARRRMKEKCKSKGSCKGWSFFKMNLKCLVETPEQQGHLIVEVGKGAAHRSGELSGYGWFGLYLLAACFLLFLASCSIRLHCPN